MSLTCPPPESKTECEMKRILITGGAGFIGGNFVRHIFEKYPKYHIVVLDALTYAGTIENLPVDLNRKPDPRFEFWYGNVRNAELMADVVSKVDTVIHFAAESHVTRSIHDNLLFYETDVIGTQVVANAVLQNRKRIERFIHISTSEVYGTAERRLMDEEHPLNPRSPYASAKCGADRLVYSYYTTYKLPIVIVRPFNNFGPRQHLEKVVPRFITSCILGEPLTVHGDGRAARDWLYVQDHCEFLDRLLHVDIGKVAGEVINVGTGASKSVLDLAKAIPARMGIKKPKVSWISNRPGQVDRHTAGIAKARRLLGWEPGTSFEKAIDETIEWYSKNQVWWEKQLWMRSIPITDETGKRMHH